MIRKKEVLENKTENKTESRTRHRTSSTWRYRVIKHYKHRAQKFQMNSKTPEEREAWGKVVQWFDDILARKYLNQNDALGIPLVPIEELEETKVLVDKDKPPNIPHHEP